MCLGKKSKPGNICLPMKTGDIGKEIFFQVENVGYQINLAQRGHWIDTNVLF
jgi:hypothetical protein